MVVTNSGSLCRCFFLVSWRKSWTKPRTRYQEFANRQKYYFYFVTISVTSIKVLILFSLRLLQKLCLKNGHGHPSLMTNNRVQSTWLQTLGAFSRSFRFLFGVIFCLCGKCVTIYHARSTQYARWNGRDIEITTLFNEPGKTMSRAGLTTCSSAMILCQLYEHRRILS